MLHFCYEMLWFIMKHIRAVLWDDIYDEKDFQAL